MSDWPQRWAISLGALYLRNAPFVRGRYRISSILLPRLRRLGPHMGTRVVRTRYRFRFHADLGDWLGQYVFLTGEYEPSTAALFGALVERGDTVIDIGANAGFFTLLCAILTGPRGRVLAFEPVPGVRDCLQSNVDLNGLRNIEILAKAVSDKSAAITIYEGPEGHKGVSSMRPIESASRPITVDAIALNDIASTLDRVRCIKIDVEGAEMLALLGMDKLVERDHPYFIIEFTDEYLRSFGHTVSDMTDWLRNRGYQLYRIAEHGLIPMDPGGHPPLPRQYNVLACQQLPSKLNAKIRLR